MDGDVDRGSWDVDRGSWDSRVVFDAGKFLNGAEVGVDSTGDVVQNRHCEVERCLYGREVCLIVEIRVRGARV